MGWAVVAAAPFLFFANRRVGSPLAGSTDLRWLAPLSAAPHARLCPASRVLLRSLGVKV